MVKPRSAIEFTNLGASKLGKVAIQDVRINMVQASNSNHLGLEVLCGAPKVCKVPETCFHVRHALHRRVDGDLIETLRNENVHKIGIVTRIRVPLAQHIWLRADIPLYIENLEKPSQTCEVSVRGWGLNAHPTFRFEFGNHGADDLKWHFINCAAQELDKDRNRTAFPQRQCHRCSKPVVLDINNESDYAWAVTWTMSGNLCSQCVRTNAKERYNMRSSLDFTISPTDDQW